MPEVAIDFDSMIIREEGETLHAYQDHLGFWTLGVGRLIDQRKGGGISRRESRFLLANDKETVMAGLDARLSWWRMLNEPRQAVLMGMCFQMGVDGLMEFRNTLNFVRTGQWLEAAKGMLASRWAAQTPERAKRMADQMRYGVWQ